MIKYLVFICLVCLCGCSINSSFIVTNYIPEKQITLKLYGVTFSEINDKINYPRKTMIFEKEKKLEEKIILIYKETQSLLGLYNEPIKPLIIYVLPRKSNVQKLYHSTRAFRVRGFYSIKKKAIFISLETMSSSLLAHEICHHLTAKNMTYEMTEILARYVGKNIY